MIGSRVKTGRGAAPAPRKVIACVLTIAMIIAPMPAAGQAPPATRPTAVPAELTGREVVEVRIVGRTKPVSSLLQSEIFRQVRTRPGQPLDPATVESDYQRIYGLRRFSNVEARIEPTDRGAIVVFEVTEQNVIREIRFRGNERVDTTALQNVVNLSTGETIDRFRIGLARDAIERLYRTRNFPHARVTVDEEELARSALVTFNIVEGPQVRVRKVRILGNRSFTNSRVKDQVKTRSWFPFFVSGTYDPDQIEQDVASIRQFYESRGFFDVRVGRTVTVSPDQTEVMVNFVIDEGPRYLVDRVSFRGNASVPEAELREGLRLTEGRFYDQDLVRRDVRQIVRTYSPLGFIHVPQDPNPDPDYLQIRDQRIFRREAGTVELVYDIREGKPFRLGPIIVKGNAKTQDKVVLREMRVQPGELYNSAEIQSAQDRIRATGLFGSVTITPIEPPPSVAEVREDEPGVRALLVEVNEAQTARLLVGAGVTSNAGVLGNISYEQRNFDITNWPASPGEFFSSKSFTGAGQTFRIQIEPGTELTRARVDFLEPWIFDQPYSFGASAYLSQRLRRDWIETRIGGRLSLGKRFSDVWSARVSLRGEDVEISDIDDEANRAREVLELEGHSTVTSVGLEITRNTTDSPILPSSGTITSFGYERVGALGGEFDFDKFSLGHSIFTTVYEDLLDRRTIVAVRADAGYISGDAPFFERFYGGGLGSVRGFRFRGISPRSGIEEDPIGGEFSLTGSVELNFPIAAEVLRGVLFLDAGTVQRDVEFGKIRAAAGFGFRLTLPVLGQLPIALDFGFPISKDDEDDTRIFSFSLGLVQ